MQFKGGNAMSRRRSLLAWVSLIPWLPAFGADKSLRPPLQLPFHPERKGERVAIEVRVVEDRKYWLDLQLGYREGDIQDWRRVQAIAGRYEKDKDGRLIEPGVNVPLHLIITGVETQGERLIVDEKVLEQRMYGSGPRQITKRIMGVRLRPGRYRVIVETLEEVPVLEFVSVNLSIGFDPTVAPFRE